MFSNIKEMIAGVAGDVDSFFSKITDKATFKRVIYAAYLIAMADGTFDSDEKTALSKLIAKDFPQFKLTDILETLKDAMDKIEFDATFGRHEIMDEISRAKGDNAALIIRTACYIGAADGDFDADEKKVASEICTKLGISPSDYGL